MKTLDCRGMSCPQPVLETKKVLAKAGSETVTVLVDNPGSRENVRRFAQSQGYGAATDEVEGGFSIRIQKKGAIEPTISEPKTVQAEGRPVVYIDSDTLGRGSEELGRILMGAFLHTLEEAGPRPDKIVFINSGVKLACEGSTVLDNLSGLADKGVEILSCGTCLDFFGLKEKIKVGRISNMYEILDSLSNAGRVLKM